MTKKPSVAVVAGGYSSEYVVSVKSAKFVMSCIDTEKFTPYLVEISKDGWYLMADETKVVEIDKSDFSATVNNSKINFDFAYIIIHGTPGEDGVLQGYFDLLNIPYSSSDLQSSSLSFNKYYCNNFLRGAGVRVSNSIRLVEGDSFSVDQIVDDLKLPMFVKPNVGGSSFGVTKVKAKEELAPAIATAFEEAPEVMVEAFLDGPEFTCGVYRLNGETIALPVTEVIPENEFFNYDSKYHGEVQEITPARISDHETESVQSMTKRIYNRLGCSGIARIDYIKVDDEFVFLEANTVPGMTATSFIPQQVEAAGLDIKILLTQLIEAKLK